MTRPQKYIGNDKLESLCKNVSFELFLFDDHPVNFNLIDDSTGGEIDAIALYKNLILIIEVYSGRNHDEVIKKLTEFRRDSWNIGSIDEVKILKVSNSNKSAKKRGEKLLQSLLKKVDVYRNHREVIRKVFFCPEIDVSEDNEDRYARHGIYIIDKEVVTYFDEIFKTLESEYLFRDLMGFLSVRKMDLEKISAAGTGQPSLTDPKKVIRLELANRGMIMYSTSFPIKDLEQYVTVFRIGQKRYDTKGFQRMIKNNRLLKIVEEYLSRNETFPNNVIIALDPELYGDEKEFYNERRQWIRLYDEYNSLIIIDGQHRFFSFFKGKMFDREILVNLIYFRGGVRAIPELYRMFDKINRKQENIEASLSFVLKALIEPKSDAGFWFLVFKKLNNEKGFFKNKVSFKERQLRYEDEKSIVSVINYGGILKLNDDKTANRVKFAGLNVLYANKNWQGKIRFAANLLKNYFNIVQDVLIEQNKNKEDLSPREIGALIRLIRHFLIKDARQLLVLGQINDFSGLSAGRRRSVNYIKRIVGKIDFKAIINSDLPASNWAGTEGLLLRQINDSGTKFGSRKILSPKGLKIYNKKRAPKWYEFRIDT